MRRETERAFASSNVDRCSVCGVSDGDFIHNLNFINIPSDYITVQGPLLIDEFIRENGGFPLIDQNWTRPLGDVGKSRFIQKHFFIMMRIFGLEVSQMKDDKDKTKIKVA